jgi:hypothetical protein
MIISDLLSNSLMRARRVKRRHLYIWEARALAFLADSPWRSINAWTADRVRAYADGRPILPGWSSDTYPIEYIRQQYSGVEEG